MQPYRLIVSSTAHAAAFHLLEEGAGFDGAHEYNEFHCLDDGAGVDNAPHGTGAKFVES